MISLKGIKKVYDINKKHGIKVKALEDVSLDFSSKGLVAVVGRSGSGKTTLLNILGGIDKPTSGEIIYNGQSFKDYKEADFDLYRNHDVSFIFQDYNLLNDYSVIENIKIACCLQGKSGEESAAKAEKALKAVGLEDLARRKISSLSGGQQQRVAIARAIAKDSAIVLCDEPTGNLDSATASEIFELLKQTAHERLVIVVTHDRESADKYADRLIVLRDGKIIEDKAQSPLPQPLIKAVKTKKRGGISLKDTLMIIRDNLKKSLIGNIAVMLLLIAAITLATVFLSLTKYDPEDALINTLKRNNQGLIQITKYMDYPREEYDALTQKRYIKHGPVLCYEMAAIEDLDYLIELTEGKADFYKSYFFNKNLQDFTDGFIFANQTSFCFEARCFREAVAVEDFSAFNMRLKYGGMPQAPNDILIYDYMANSLLHYGVFWGGMQSVAGQVLTDADTGLSMRVSGVLSSDYELYSYIKNDNNRHEFEETYLTSLQTIFCKPELIALLEAEKAYSPIYKCYFLNETSGEAADTDIKKLKHIDINDLDFIAAIENHEQERGAIVDKATVAEILNIDQSQVNEETAKEFLNSYSAAGIKDYYDYSFERNYLTGFSHRIIAVAEDALEEDILHWHTPNADDLRMQNSAFRQFYLSLGKDWKVNKAVLSKFKYQTHDRQFYEANPDYYFEGYTDYTSYGLLIRDADYYLVKVKNFAKTIMIILILATSAGLFFYALLSIKKYGYKIGVLKALGAKNLDIASIFGAQILAITLLSLALSIPLSYGVMTSINASFIGDINPNLVFFAIKPSAIGFMFIYTFAAVILSICAPLIRLLTQTPMAIIRSNSRK